MKKLFIAVVIAALTAPLAAVPALTQTEQPELAKVDWYRVEMIKWKPGKGERAQEIIELFEKADKEAGMKGVIDIHMNTGEWDTVVAFPMTGGIAQMGWATNPEDKKWEAVFSRQVGGEDKAKALYEEFDSLIAERQRHVGHIDRD
jgi:hypothetical protein